MTSLSPTSILTQLALGKKIMHEDKEVLRLLPDTLDPVQAKVGKEIVESQALHPDFIVGLAKVAEVSIQKGYEPFNYLRQESPTRVSTFLQAGARHVREAKKGYDTNQEKKMDGTPIAIRAHHLVYAAYNYLMAAQIINYLPDHDDRLWEHGELKE